MNNQKITKEIINSIYNDSSFKCEIYYFLTALIDEEVLKENPDCDFIDDCVNTLECILNDDYSTVIPFINRNNLSKGVHRRRVISILVAAAILLSAGIGAVAVNYTIEKKKAETVTTTTATTVSTTSEKTTASTSATTTTATSKTVTLKCENLRLMFNNTVFKDEYIIGEKLDLSGVSVYARYSDGTEKNVPISECKVIADDAFGTKERYEVIKISYNGFSESFKVRVLRDSDTKVLNSIYAMFPDGFNFSASDINNIDLNGMEVYAVYSDDSEEKLNKKDYDIKTEKMPDGKTAMITISYEGVYTTFGIKEEEK